ncbi:MAG: hypothetical protein IJ059_00830 [Prevotella sp.]|nr:hypothetical protein [Prevotella sp.]
MSKLFVFNPEHDLALASNLANFTAPHAGRQLRADLCYLPALWAGPDDYVLVEHVEQARRLYGRLRARVGGKPARFVDKRQLSHININKVEPWGWDLALRSSLIRYGVPPEACAVVAEIAAVRERSHRRFSAEVLRRMGGEAPCEAMSVQDVEHRLITCSRLVVKAPWSSSGRGVRFIDGQLTDYHRGWLRNVIQQQGSVMVEPYYPKVKDFGMEFEALPDGGIRYLGLSLFDTRNGAYTGNIIASEDDKLEMISRYIPTDSIIDIREKLMGVLRDVFGRHYTGPFGVDMMILSRTDGQGFLIHPCVEINLRRTMGHVAITMAHTSSPMPPRVMQITLSDKYRIRIRKL